MTCGEKVLKKEPRARQGPATRGRASCNPCTGLTPEQVGALESWQILEPTKKIRVVTNLSGAAMNMPMLPLMGGGDEDDPMDTGPPTLPTTTTTTPAAGQAQAPPNQTWGGEDALEAATWVEVMDGTPTMKFIPPQLRPTVAALRVKFMEETLVATTPQGKTRQPKK